MKDPQNVALTLIVLAFILGAAQLFLNRKKSPSIDDETVESLKQQQQKRVADQQKLRDDVDDYIAGKRG